MRADVMMRRAASARPYVPMAREGHIICDGGTWSQVRNAPGQLSPVIANRLVDG
jgi:hypothetical protein